MYFKIHQGCKCKTKWCSQSTKGASERPSGAASQPRVQIQSLAGNHIVSQLFNFLRQTYPPLILSAVTHNVVYIYISMFLCIMLNYNLTCSSCPKHSNKMRPETDTLRKCKNNAMVYFSVRFSSLPREQWKSCCFC